MSEEVKDTKDTNLSVSSGTIARLIVLAIALLNQVCAMLGWTPLDIDEDSVYQVCTVIATLGASIWAFWKNNSFTKAAMIGDSVMKEEKEKAKE